MSGCCLSRLLPWSLNGVHLSLLYTEATRQVRPATDVVLLGDSIHPASTYMSLCEQHLYNTCTEDFPSGGTPRCLLTPLCV